MATKKQNKITAITLLSNQIEALNLTGDWTGIAPEDQAQIMDQYGQITFKIVKRLQTIAAAHNKRQEAKAVKVAKALEKKQKALAKKEAKAQAKAAKEAAAETKAQEKKDAAAAKVVAREAAKAEKLAAKEVARKAKEEAAAAPDLTAA